MQCVQADVATQSCPHLRSLRKDGFADPGRHSALVRLLQCLLENRPSCAIMTEILQGEVRHLVPALDGEVE